MKIVQEQILFDCLEQFEAGVPVEELIAKYPQVAEEIEKFLAAAAQLQQLNLQPSLAAKKQSQKLFLQEAAKLRADRRKAWFSWRRLQRTLLPLTSLAMVAVLFAITLLFASASALPGDLLYNAKRWVESYQLEQAGDATAVFNLNGQMSQERMREVKALLRTNETAEVTFAGLINAKQGNNWVIAGVSVKINTETQVEGRAEIGAIVLVNGRTQNGHLYASRITVLEEVPATVTPRPSVTASPTPAITATSTIIATGTATATPTSEITATPTDPTTPTSSSTPIETPTETAVPPTATTEPTSVPTVVVNDDNNDDNGNDNSGNDGGNENAGDDNSNDNSANDNGNNNSGDDNGNDNSGGDNGNDNDDNGNNNDDDNDNGGNSGSGGGGDNDNGNDNGRRNDD